MDTCPGTTPTPLLSRSECCAGWGPGVPVLSPSLREEAGTRRAGKARRPKLPAFSPKFLKTPIFSIWPTLAPYSLFLLQQLDAVCQVVSFLGEKVRSRKLLVTTVGEQKPAAPKSRFSVQNNFSQAKIF